MWRPEGWKNRYSPPDASTNPVDVRLQRIKADVFEVGADAMLEALRKQAGTRFGIKSPDGKTYSMVFIPDDEPDERTTGGDAQ